MSCRNHRFMSTYINFQVCYRRCRRRCHICRFRRQTCRIISKYFVVFSVNAFFSSYHYLLFYEKRISLIQFSRSFVIRFAYGEHSPFDALERVSSFLRPF